MTDRQQPNLLKENMPGPPVAVLAEALFLANLMLIPVLGFVLMLVLWWKFRHSDSAIVRNHLQQTVVTSISGAAILIGVSVAIFLLGGLDNPVSWVIGVLYFLCVHAVLILLGMIGLNRAILARKWRYPLLGPRIEE